MSRFNDIKVLRGILKDFKLIFVECLKNLISELSSKQ